MTAVQRRNLKYGWHGTCWLVRTQVGGVRHVGQPGVLEQVYVKQQSLSEPKCRANPAAVASQLLSAVLWHAACCALLLRYDPLAPLWAAHLCGTNHYDCTCSCKLRTLQAVR
jgi:hypothetical protein